MPIDFKHKGKGTGKGKVKGFPVHAVNAYRGSGGVCSPILNLVTNGGEW
jgi:hypothetical protein